MISLTALGPVFYGFSLGVLSFRSYSFQREILKGENRRSAMVVAAHQAIMATLLMATLRLAFPILGSFYAVSAATFVITAYPFIAGLAAGGYSHIRKSASRTQVSLLIKALDFADRALSILPEPLVSRCSKLFGVSHAKLGDIFLRAQVLILALIVPTQPLLGLSALGYFQVSYLRAVNRLPMRVAKSIEKFNYWVGLFSGIFLRSTVLKSVAVFRIAKEFLFNIVAPKVFTNLMGENSEFVQVTDLSKTSKNPVRIGRNIKAPRFLRILELLPKINVGSKLEGLQLDHVPTQYEALQLELSSLINEFDAEINTLPSLDEFRTIRPMRPFPKEGIILQLAYVKDAYVRVFKTNVKLLQQMLPVAKEFFDKKMGHKKYETTAAHMARVPRFLPAAPHIDLDKFLEEINPRIENLARNFRGMCLESSKFHAINFDLSTRIMELEDKKEKLIQRRREISKEVELLHDSSDTTGALIYLRQELTALEEHKHRINEQINATNLQCLELWKQSFQLADGTSDEQVLSAYIKMRLQKVCHQIATGEDMLWDKMAASLTDFQQMAMHLIHHCLNLLRSDEEHNIQQAELILSMLAIDGGDFCANGIYDVVEQLYGEYVLGKLYIEYKDLLTPEDKIAIYLQEERQSLFNLIYDIITRHPIISGLFPDIDFQDRHTRSAVVKALSVLNLKAKFNAQTDLSNQQSGFISEIMMHFLAYFIARAIMLLDNGYSPENILRNISKQFKSGENLVSFNVAQCCMDWAQTFEDPKITEYIEDTLIAVDDEERNERDRMQLYTAMLYDYGIINCLDLTRQQRIEKLSPCARPLTSEPSRMLLFAKHAGLTAFRSGSYIVNGVRDCADYITRDATPREARALDAMRGPSVYF